MEEIFALFDGYCADQDRLPLFVAGDYLLDYRTILSGLGFIDDIGLVDTRNGLVGRNLNDIELVDRLKFPPR